MEAIKKESTDNTPGPMDNCQRCPDCHRLPDMRVIQDYEKKDAIELRCDQHGHIAMGKDLYQTVEHWNIYINFTVGMRKAS